jgi:acetyl esterase
METREKSSVRWFVAAMVGGFAFVRYVNIPNRRRIDDAGVVVKENPNSTFFMKIITLSFAYILLLGMLSLGAGAADFKDVEYAQASGVHLTLDAHIPDGAGPFLTAILVHGGGWIAGDKQQYITYLFKPLADAGIAWFSINYRLAPQFKFPADADDVEAAIRFVKANAAKYKVDPKRIALIGESAGGHLVAYVGARNRPDSRVAAVVSMYGIHDFIAAAVAWKPVPHEILDLFGIQAVDVESAPTLIKASPVTYISPDMPPFLLIHGSQDRDVPYAQSVEMCSKMKEAGARCQLITVKGAPHGMDHWEPHPEFHWYKKALIDWLQKTLS